MEKKLIKLNALAEDICQRMEDEKALRDTPDKSFVQGVRHGFRMACELLRSDQAGDKCISGTKGIGSFVSHEEWAEWLEKQMES